MDTPVELNAARIVLMDALGHFSFITAQAPATCGDAIDVPEACAAKFPDHAETMLTPGAYKSKKLALFEKLATLSLLSVAPTLMAVEIQAG